jgi:hypothetical protein
MRRSGRVAEHTARVNIEITVVIEVAASSGSLSGVWFLDQTSWLNCRCAAHSEVGQSAARSQAPRRVLYWRRSAAPACQGRLGHRPGTSGELHEVLVVPNGFYWRGAVYGSSRPSRARSPEPAGTGPLLRPARRPRDPRMPQLQRGRRAMQDPAIRIAPGPARRQRSRRRGMKPAMPKPQRCAIYTRKSTEHNLDLAFNSLDGATFRLAASSPMPPPRRASLPRQRILCREIGLVLRSRVAA